MEAEGIRRAEAHREVAELIIYVLDASKPLEKDQRRIESCRRIARLWS